MKNPARSIAKKASTCLAVAVAFVGSVALMPVGVAGAHAPSGAIFTTLPDGSAVNFNIYPSKESVYLDGGPGIQAPQTAAGLDDGIYVFQVTDPSGRTLLSQDQARCRQFTVSNGVIDGVVDTGCQHVTGVDVDHGAVTVQLMPYADTPNNGGVYKVWVTEVGDFIAGCEEFGVSNGLDVVDCGNRGGNRHGFVPAHSKTDNFKVGDEDPGEIDTRFWRNGELVDGLQITWYDTNGASNVKYSEWNPGNMVFHEAHVEAVENGFHHIQIEDQPQIGDQPGCEVHDIWMDGEYVGHGAQTVQVHVKPNSFSANNSFTIWIDVDCH